MADTCANCGTGIGKLETPHVWREQIVCAPCYGRLAGAGTVAYAGPSTPPPLVPGDGRGVQTIEKTGKKWKSQQLIAACLAILGIILTCSGMGSDMQHRPGQGPGGVAGVGFMMVLVGILWFLAARIGAWWNHG